MAAAHGLEKCTRQKIVSTAPLAMVDVAYHRWRMGTKFVWASPRGEFKSISSVALPHGLFGTEADKELEEETAQSFGVASQSMAIQEGIAGS